jgi:hypothetical protein
MPRVPTRTGTDKAQLLTTGTRSLTRPASGTASIGGTGVDYKDQSFEGVTVELDGNSYERCVFRNVVFSYSGGHLHMKECSLDRFSFKFGGALATGLYALYQLFGTEGMLQIIRGFTDRSAGEIELQLGR